MKGKDIVGEPRSKVSQTAVDRIAGELRAAIEKGIYAEGQRITAAEISDMFGVSFGPAREALRRLAGEGLIDFVPHKGATVRSFSEKYVRDFFQIREALEGYAARLAAENIHRADYRLRLETCGEKIARIMGKDEERATSADYVSAESVNVRQQYHDLIYEIAGNEKLKEEALRFTYPLQRAKFNALMGRDREQESLSEHREIIDAILAGDGARAERLTRCHLRNSAYVVCEILGKSN